jgi:hypothetical protein
MLRIVYKSNESILGIAGIKERSNQSYFESNLSIIEFANPD